MVGLVVAVGVSAVVVKFAPQWLASTDGLDPQEKAEELGRVRTALLALLAGAIATIGAIYTGRSYSLARQGQITERFTRAVEQLGHEQTTVRVGGIFALERIARDSRSDHGPIVEVLTAYVREHARWRGVADETSAAGGAGHRRPAGDVQAALTVLGRRDTANDAPRLPLRLSDVDLRGASLRGGHFNEARFRHAHLERARLEGVELEGAELRGVYLIGADLQEDADLGLAPADLRGADLSSAHLDGARLTGARYDSRTQWPTGFDPVAAGCIKSERRGEPERL